MYELIRAGVRYTRVIIYDLVYNIHFCRLKYPSRQDPSRNINSYAKNDWLPHQHVCDLYVYPSNC